jgi:prepilin-type N-terminal cleavage/methylation domain-containing protein
MRLKNKNGFTLLEIIIVIIIIGVLASLALPRLFSTVEFSRSAEALAAFATIRGAMERCYLMNNATYVGCTLTAAATNLDIENPALAPNAHFTYAVANQAVAGYQITATRTTRDGGTAGDIIRLTQAAGVITRTGTGAFSAIK